MVIVQTAVVIVQTAVLIVQTAVLSEVFFGWRQVLVREMIGFGWKGEWFLVRRTMDYGWEDDGFDKR